MKFLLQLELCQIVSNHKDIPAPQKLLSPLIFLGLELFFFMHILRS